MSGRRWGPGGPHAAPNVWAASGGAANHSFYNSQQIAWSPLDQQQQWWPPEDWQGLCDPNAYAGFGYPQQYNQHAFRHDDYSGNHAVGGGGQASTTWRGRGGGGGGQGRAAKGGNFAPVSTAIGSGAPSPDYYQGGAVDGYAPSGYYAPSPAPVGQRAAPQQWAQQAAPRAGRGRHERSSPGAAQAAGGEGAAVSEADGGRGGGGRRGKGKGRGGWAEGLPRHVRISKTLTQILRHKAPDLGISIDPAGFCKTEDVLATNWLQQLDCTLEDVEKVVKESDKQRFEVQIFHEVHHIRAVQGHSIEAVEDEASLTKLTPDSIGLPQQCVHGTYRRHLPSIMEGGLKPGGADGSCFRKHIHFISSMPGDKRIISGFRYDAEVAIWIDLKRAMEAGVPFYISPNKVILSPGKDEAISPELFLKVTYVKGGKEIPLTTDWAALAQS